jgi:SAM-dependent methyltransferase
MYVRRQLRKRPPGTFVEIGAGQGVISQLLVELGWNGTAWDLNDLAIEAASLRNRRAVESGRLGFFHGDWLASQPQSQVDLVVSSMVLEHLDPQSERRYFDRAREELRPDGFGALLVPASPRHWGIEDVIAGHFRRYTAAVLRETVEASKWRVDHLAGLTYPLSNVLLPLSNRQVAKYERDRASLDLPERTRRSGNRDVPWKTRFPSIVSLLVNELTLKPFDVWQRVAAENPHSLVLYCECSPGD